MNILCRGDWTSAGQLDEEKLAERMIQDDRLTVLQRYRIACAYSLIKNIPQLWRELTQEEKQSITGIDEPRYSQESHRLVLLWSYWVDGHREKEVTRRKNYLWTYAVRQSLYYGNLATMMTCWKRLKERIQHKEVFRMAWQSLELWRTTKNKFRMCDDWRENLISNRLPHEQAGVYLQCFNLPSTSRYSELMFFFLSQMNEQQQLEFFKKASDSILICFLDWPERFLVDFLPTIKRLWGIIPKEAYGECLLTLAGRCKEKDQKKRFPFASLHKRKNNLYDYRSLLEALWEETPEEYKRYVFLDKEGDFSRVLNEGKTLLPLLLERSPFQGKDETLFRRVLFYQPQEERKAMIHSDVGENMCLTLVKKEKLSFLNWLLGECLPKDEIPSFKKQFVQSVQGYSICCSKLEKKREQLVKDLIDWAFEVDTEKTEYKYALITNKTGCFGSRCEDFLRVGRFTEVERIINFCVPSGERIESIKMNLALNSCKALFKEVEHCVLLDECIPWKQMDEILAWCIDAEDKIGDLKRDLFSAIGIDVHYQLVFMEKGKKYIECLYIWFSLSPEEIKKLKRDTVFRPVVIKDICEQLLHFNDRLVSYLLSCLTDEEMVMDLKKEIEEHFKQVAGKKVEAIKQQLDVFVDTLLDGLRENDVRDKKSKKVCEQKRSSVVIKDESSSPRKRFRKSIQE